MHQANSQASTSAPATQPGATHQRIQQVIPNHGSLRTRGWVFTLNNPTQALDLHHPSLQWVLYAPEVGDSGTPHFQGAIQFKNPVTLSQVQQVFHPFRPHLEWRKAKPYEAVLYCVKVSGSYYYYKSFILIVTPACRHS